MGCIGLGRERDGRETERDGLARREQARERERGRHRQIKRHMQRERGILQAKTRPLNHDLSNSVLIETSSKHAT